MSCSRMVCNFNISVCFEVRKCNTTSVSYAQFWAEVSSPEKDFGYTVLYMITLYRQYACY